MAGLTGRSTVQEKSQTETRPSMFWSPYHEASVYKDGQTVIAGYGGNNSRVNKIAYLDGRFTQVLPTLTQTPSWSAPHTGQELIC